MGAVKRFFLSSYCDCENLDTLISGRCFLSRIDKLRFAVMEEDIKDLYLSAHLFDRELVGSLSDGPHGAYPVFGYSLNSQNKTGTVSPFRFFS